MLNKPKHYFLRLCVVTKEKLKVIEPKFEDPRNAPEWFKKEYCENCDPKCLGSELDQIKCIVANVLFELVNLSECLCGEQWDKEVKQAADEVKKILKP